jgi:glutathione-independent formaldehyde dehydrogenase
MVLGHEITGEIIEIGRDVEYLGIGALVSAPFNVACGRCRTCREDNSGVCLNVNLERAGGAYGYRYGAGGLAARPNTSWWLTPPSTA